LRFLTESGEDPPLTDLRELLRGCTLEAFDGLRGEPKSKAVAEDHEHETLLRVVGGAFGTRFDPVRFARPQDRGLVRALQFHVFRFS
jgi:hypothetical protein